MRPIPLLWLLAVVCAGTWSCELERTAPSNVTVSDSSGVRIVRQSVETLPLLATESLRLGVVDGGGPEQFSEINTLALGRDRQIFVGNGASGSVRVFDRFGTFLNEFGARGDGPAEVRAVNDLFVVGDTVAVVDWQRGGKVVLFSADGTFLANWTVRQPDARRIQPVHGGPNGWLATVYDPASRPSLEPGEALSLTTSFYRIEFGSPDLGPRVYEFHASTIYGMPGTDGEEDWSLFRPRVFHGFDARGRVFFTDPQAYRIDVMGEQGTELSVRRSWDLRPLTDDDVVELKASALNFIDTLSLIPDRLRPAQRQQLSDRLDRQASLPLPDVVSPLGALLVSAEGSFWVETVDTSAPARRAADEMFGTYGGIPLSETRWDLFTAEGAYRGTVVLPARFRPEAVNDTTVAGVWLDGLDVEYVRVFGVSPPGEL